jgi:hypothetical protein
MAPRLTAIMSDSSDVRSGPIALVRRSVHSTPPHYGKRELNISEQRTQKPDDGRRHKRPKVEGIAEGLLHKVHPPPPGQFSTSDQYSYGVDIMQNNRGLANPMDVPSQNGFQDHQYRHDFHPISDAMPEYESGDQARNLGEKRVARAVYADSPPCIESPYDSIRIPSSQMMNFHVSEIKPVQPSTNASSSSAAPIAVMVLPQISISTCSSSSVQLSPRQAQENKMNSMPSARERESNQDDNNRTHSAVPVGDDKYTAVHTKALLAGLRYPPPTGPAADRASKHDTSGRSKKHFNQKGGEMNLGRKRCNERINRGARAEHECTKTKQQHTPLRGSQNERGRTDQVNRLSNKMDDFELDSKYVVPEVECFTVPTSLYQTEATPEILSQRAAPDSTSKTNNPISSRHDTRSENDEADDKYNPSYLVQGILSERLPDRLTSTSDGATPKEEVHPLTLSSRSPIGSFLLRKISNISEKLGPRSRSPSSASPTKAKSHHLPSPFVEEPIFFKSSIELQQEQLSILCARSTAIPVSPFAGSKSILVKKESPMEENIASVLTAYSFKRQNISAAYRQSKTVDSLCSQEDSIDSKSSILDCSASLCDP